MLPVGILEGFSSTPVTALGLNGGKGDSMPACWSILKPGDLVRPSELRQEFFCFLDAWPDRAENLGRSFNELFTVGSGYSIWWTTVAADRQATRGIVKYFQYAALVDRTVARSTPDTILLFTKDPLFARLLLSRADHSGIAVERLEGCADPVAAIVDTGRSWLWRSLGHALMSPLQRLAFAIQCRWALRHADLLQRSPRPTVVCASTWPRHLALRNGQFSRVYWDEIGAALERIGPSLGQAYLPRKVAEIVDAGTLRSGLDAIAQAGAPLLIWERYFPLRGVLSRIVRQIQLLWRFNRLAQQSEFHRSFRFANTNLAPILVPDLKAGVARAIDWSF